MAPTRESLATMTLRAMLTAIEAALTRRDTPGKPCGPSEQQAKKPHLPAGYRAGARYAVGKYYPTSTDAAIWRGGNAGIPPVYRPGRKWATEPD